MLRFLLVGGNFGNKGAQSMLFTCINEFSKRFPGSECYFCTSETLKDYKNYRFNYVHIGNHSLEFERGDYRFLPKMILKGIVRKISGNGNRILEELELGRIISSIDMIVDISGFALSSDFGTGIPGTYFSWFEIACRRGIPLVLMPQSFGPFDYRENQEKIDHLANKYLNYATLVFAREEKSYKSVKDRFDPRGLRYCPDSVLVGEFPDSPDKVFKESRMNIPDLDGEGWVGVIPNKRTTEKGIGWEAVLNRYIAAIRHLRKIEKRVCVLTHSAEDIDICRSLEKALEDGVQDIRFIYNDLSCFEYDALCRKFDFIVSSRYHSIIHAYRHTVPVIALAWAEKYRALATLFGQEKYVLDITCEREDVDDEIRSMIDDMTECNSCNKENVSESLVNIRRKYNCFAEMKALIESSLK